MKVMNVVLLLQIFWFYETSANSNNVYERSYSSYDPRISYSRYPYNNFYSAYNRGRGFNRGYYNRGYYNRGYYNRGYNALYQSGLLGILGGLVFGGYRGYNGYGYGSGISSNIFGGDSFISHNQNYHINNNNYDDHSSNHFDSDFPDGSVGEGNSDPHDDDGLSNADSDSGGNDNDTAGNVGDAGEAEAGNGSDVGDAGEADIGDVSDGDSGDI